MLAYLPHALDVVNARAGVWVNKVLLVVDSDVLVAQLIEISVRCPAVSYYYRIWIDVLFDERLERPLGSIDDLN